MKFSLVSLLFVTTFTQLLAHQDLVADATGYGVGGGGAVAAGKFAKGAGAAGGYTNVSYNWINFNFD